MKLRFWRWIYDVLWNACDCVYWNHLHVPDAPNVGRYTVVGDGNATCTVKVVDENVVSVSILHGGSHR